MELRNAVIVDGVRSPFARAVRGKLVATRLDELGAKVVRQLLERNPKIEDHMIEDVGLGNVLALALIFQQRPDASRQGQAAEERVRQRVEDLNG